MQDIPESTWLQDQLAYLDTSYSFVSVLSASGISKPLIFSTVQWTVTSKCTIKRDENNYIKRRWRWSLKQASHQSYLQNICLFRQQGWYSSTFRSSQMDIKTQAWFTLQRHTELSSAAQTHRDIYWYLSCLLKTTWFIWRIRALVHSDCWSYYWNFICSPRNPNRNQHLHLALILKWQAEEIVKKFLHC